MLPAYGAASGAVRPVFTASMVTVASATKQLEAALPVWAERPLGVSQAS